MIINYSNLYNLKIVEKINLNLNNFKNVISH